MVQRRSDNRNDDQQDNPSTPKSKSSRGNFVWNAEAWQGKQPVRPEEKAETADPALPSPRNFSVHSRRTQDRGHRPIPKPSLIAQDLHDNILPSVMYMQMELSDVKSKASQEVAERLEALEQLAKQTYHDMRVALGIMRSNETGFRTLQEELKQRAEAIRQKTSGVMAPKVVCPAEPVMAPRAVSRHVGSIVHEAAWNAWKHCGDPRLTITMARTKQGIEIAVIDGGKGFDASATRNGHYGLHTMRERASAIGGSLSITSAPGHGTRVILTIPQHALKQKASKEASHAS